MSQLQTSPLVSLSPLVSCFEGTPATTSLKVAESFSKRHCEVLRSIENLKANCPADFNERNFASVDYVDSKGEKRPMYILPRDGFTLLVMGYTGKKAMEFKLKYIEAFNAMEEELRRQRESSAHAAPDSAPLLSTSKTRKPLRALVHSWSQITGVYHAMLWPQIKAHFSLSRIDDLPEAWIPDALAFVQGKIDEALRMKGTASLPPIPSREALTPCTQLMPISRKEYPAASVVDEALRNALKHLTNAFQHCQFTDEASAPKESERRSLYIAAMCNIDAAAAIVRAMLGAAK